MNWVLMKTNLHVILYTFINVVNHYFEYIYAVSWGLDERQLSLESQSHMEVT